MQKSNQSHGLVKQLSWHSKYLLLTSHRKFAIVLGLGVVVGSEGQFMINNLIGHSQLNLPSVLHPDP